MLKIGQVRLIGIKYTSLRINLWYTKLAMPQTNLKRIYIVGPSGSGKTTLGKFLCAKFSLPHIELDKIAYPNQKEKPLEKRLSAVARLAQQPKWVTEGIYINWTSALMEKADLIIWLDLSYKKTLFRVIKRFFVHKLRGDEKFGLKRTVKFIANLNKYYSNVKGDPEKQTTRAETKEALEPFRKKVVRIREIKDPEKFLSVLIP